MIESLFSPEALPYVVPAALGFAGAAVFSLMGPMLRGLWVVAKFPVFLATVAVDKTFGDFPDCPEYNWRFFYGKKKPQVPVLASCDYVDTRFALKDARDDARVAALEERMDAVEEPINADEAWIRDAKKRLCGNTYVSATASTYCGIDRMTYAQWREFVDNAAHENACAHTIPYAPSGKPCPKPTKDLRPGDEVSIRCRVRKSQGCCDVAIELADHHTVENGRFVAYFWNEELDALRTDK